MAKTISARNRAGKPSRTFYCRSKSDSGDSEEQIDERARCSGVSVEANRRRSTDILPLIRSEPFSQFHGAFLCKLAQNAVANDARIFGVAFVAHSFVCLPVALFNPGALLSPKRLLR
jgi:hypothetical protein